MGRGISKGGAIELLFLLEFVGGFVTSDYRALRFGDRTITMDIPIFFVDPTSQRGKGALELTCLDQDHDDVAAVIRMIDSEDRVAARRH